MDDAASAVGVEAGFFDGIVKFAGPSHLFKSKFGVGFVGRHYRNRAYADDAVEQASAKFQVDDAEHIDVVHFSVEKPPAPLNSVGGDLVAGGFQPGYFCKQHEHNESREAEAGKDTIAVEH